MTLGDISSYLESIAPLHLQEDYDNAGLLCGSPEMKISSALISLDCTEEVIREAISLGANMVISHHPIIFRGIKKIDPNYYVHKAVIAAIQNDIAIYAIHTNLDNVLQNGVNQKIAQKIGLDDLDVLQPADEQMNQEKPIYGGGVIGTLKQAMTETDFLSHLKRSMRLSMIRHTTFLNQEIQKVAICGGSGSSLLSRALKQKADAFVSADFKYHEFFEANSQILITDIGHYESEYFTIELLSELITKKFPNFAPHCTKVNTNPVNYF